MVAVGYTRQAMPNYIMVSEPGTRWFLTDDPFNGTLIAVLATGDRFTYPTEHVQAGETYRWNGSSWVFEQNMPALPDVVQAATLAAP